MAVSGRSAPLPASIADHMSFCWRPCLTEDEMLAYSRWSRD